MQSSVRLQSELNKHLAKYVPHFKAIQIGFWLGFSATNGIWSFFWTQKARVAGIRTVAIAMR
jgi:hypothetical protein